MQNDILIVNVAAGILIIFVLWWFFGSKPKAQALATDFPIMITVKDGVYQPGFLQVPAGKPLKLIFVRQDPTPCASSLLFPQLNMAYELPLNQQVEVFIPPQQPGEIEFTCQMRMFKGKIIIV